MRRSHAGTGIHFEGQFSASHNLEAVFGEGHKCSRLHGHNWKVEIDISVFPRVEFGTIIKGVILDFGKLKEIINDLDHKTIVSVLYDGDLPADAHYRLDGPSTCENLSLHIADRVFIVFTEHWANFKGIDIPMDWQSATIIVKVIESQNNSATSTITVER